MVDFLGYPVPIEYASGLEINDSWFTVTYDGNIYAANASSVPFVTGAEFDSTKWRLIQGLTGADLAAEAGSQMVGCRAYGQSAVLRTVQAKTREMLSTYDYGCIGDGATDDTAAFVSALRAGESLFDALNSGAAMSGKVVVRVIGRILLTSTVTFNPAKVCLVGPGLIVASSSGTYTNNRLFVLTDHDSVVSLSSYSNKGQPVFSSLAFDAGGASNLDFVYAYASTEDSNASAVALQNVLNCHFYRFRYVFTHGARGWGWTWWGCGANSCQRWLMLTVQTDTYERFTFDGCIWQNGGYVVECSNPNGKVYWKGGSIDYCSGICILTNGQMEVNSHIEYSARSAPLATITSGSLKVTGGLLAIVADSASHQLFQQASAYQLSIEDLVITTDANTTLGRISDLPYYSRGIRFRTDNGLQMLLRGASAGPAALNGYTVEAYGTGIAVTQAAGSITLTSSTASGSSKGALIWIPVNDAGQRPFVGWSITGVNGSTGVVFLAKAVYSPSKLDSTSVGNGGSSFVASATTTLDATVPYKITDAGKRWLRLQINCSNMVSGETFTITALKYFNE